MNESDQENIDSVDAVKKLNNFIFDKDRLPFMSAAVMCDHDKLCSFLKNEPKWVSTIILPDGYTALHYACKFGCTDIIKQLIGNYNADVNCRTFNGKTPLHVAVEFDQEEVVRLLYSQYNADKTIRDYSSRKPVDLSRKHNTTNMTNILGDFDYKSYMYIKEAHSAKLKRNESENSKSIEKELDTSIIGMGKMMLNAPKKFIQIFDSSSNVIYSSLKSPNPINDDCNICVTTNELKKSSSYHDLDRYDSFNSINKSSQLRSKTEYTSEFKRPKLFPWS